MPHPAPPCPHPPPPRPAPFLPQILLALGIGVMRSQRQKRLATAALEQSVAAGAGQALEGFGIVTLASLFPVLSVECLGIVTSLMYSFDEARQPARPPARPPACSSARPPARLLTCAALPAHPPASRRWCR